jgi:long-chain acyl-CoA synthetase
MKGNLAQLLTETTSRHGARPALKLDDAVVTYTMVNEGAARVAGLLKHRGLQPGDHVGVMLPNVPYFAAVYYGILRAGGVVVPMNVLLKGREVSFYLSDSDARQVFAWYDFAEVAEEGAAASGTEVISVKPSGFDQLLAGAPRETEDVERDGSDTAVILYTSGTTGTPKGAELTHANMLDNCFYGGTELMRISETDVILGALPLFHSFGQTCCLNTGVRAGACLTMIPRFEPGKALEVIQRDKVTLFDGVPTMYHAMLNHPERARYDVSSLRLCVSGGSAMPVEVMRGFEKRFGCIILEGYGLSETSPVASFNHPDRERKPGSIGTPIYGVEMKVVDDQGNDLPIGDVGEIVVRGHNVMKGYLNRPDATAETLTDGWLHTGDLARMDEDGYFFIVDRKKDMIIRGGYNVYPREVEEVLYEHPAVLEAAVVAVPDEALGEEVGAAIVLRPGADGSTENIRDFVKERVAAYKYPRRIWFSDQLPMGATGKVLKREIRVPEAAATQVSPISPNASNEAGRVG